MQTLEELIDLTDPAIDLLTQWVQDSEVKCEILPPSEHREDELLSLQVTTHSTLGAIAYDTGGVLIDDGWLRLLGSGHPRLTRRLWDWNTSLQSDGLFLVGDDVVGGFFALNGGTFADEIGTVYYFAPESLKWECLNSSFTDFVYKMTKNCEKFYEAIRWPNWREDIREVSNDRCFNYYPPLWLKEGSVTASRRATVPAREQFEVNIDLLQQLTGNHDDKKAT